MTTLHYLCPTCLTTVLDRDDDQALEAAIGRTCHLCGNPLDGSATSAAPMLVLATDSGAEYGAETVAILMISHLPEAMRPRLVAITSAADLTPTAIQQLRHTGAVLWLVTSATRWDTIQSYDATIYDTQHPADLHSQARIAWAKHQQQAQRKEH